MIMKKVLFLGGSGRVGETAIRYLLDHAAVELTVVTRKTVIDMEGLCSGRSSVKNVQADITCGDTLDRLLEGTDLAVSCVGPSHTVGSFIIDACVRHGVALIDVSGYDPALKHLDRLNLENQIQAPVVVNSGLLPGLSGSYPQYLIHRYGGHSPVKSIEVFYAGRDTWSFSSAVDIVSSLGGFGENRGFCRIESGKIVRTGLIGAMVKVRFPEPVGTVAGMSMYSEEMARLIKAENIENAVVSGANIGRRAGVSLMISMLLKRYGTEKGIIRGAESLVKASARDGLKYPPYYGIHCRLILENGKTVKGVLTADDTYRASGMVVGMNAVYMLTHEIKPAGYSMHEAIPAEYVIDNLSREGIFSCLQDSYEN